jgi:glutamine amidotransferase
VVNGVGDGWGLAFFQGGEVLLQRHPKQPPGGTLDFFAQVRDIKTDYLVGAIGEAITSNKLENTQPYRFRSWVFAQSGVIEHFKDVKAQLAEYIPDFLRRNIRGQNDSEHMFHLVLAFLHDAGKLDDPNIRASDAANAVSGAIAMVDSRLAGGGFARPALNVIATNGRIMIAVRRGPAMWIRRTNGLVDCTVCRETSPEWRADRRRVVHEHLRSVLLASEPATVSEGFEEIPESTVVTVSRDLTVGIQNIK